LNGAGRGQRVLETANLRALICCLKPFESVDLGECNALESRYEMRPEKIRINAENDQDQTGIEEKNE